VNAMGARLRAARQRKAWALEDLAQASGVMVATLSRLENDKQEPRPSTIRKLAAALDVEPGWLLLGEDDRAEKWAA